MQALLLEQPRHRRIVDLPEPPAFGAGVDARPWIMHRIPFADTITAFPRLREPSSGVVKAVIDIPAA